MIDSNKPDISPNVSLSGIPKVDITALHLDRILTEDELFRITQWAESDLKNRPNEPVDLLSGNTTILGIYIDGKKEQKKSYDFTPGSVEWIKYRECVRWYGKRFAKKMALAIQRGELEWLATLCCNWWGELVKNTFDHADGSSIGIVITQTNGRYYFIYRDYIEPGNKGMIGRFRDTDSTNEGYKMVDDPELMHQLLSPTKTTKLLSGVNCWLGLWMICSWIRWDGTLNISIHTDGYKFDILNPMLDFSVSPSTLPSDIWYIATPKT